jgi:hypothetical protein
MSSLQSFALCRDFIEHEATPAMAENASVLLVMKGSGVRVPASASGEGPASPDVPRVVEVAESRNGIWKEASGADVLDDVAGRRRPLF